jgi:hypothetical protein
VTTVMISGLVDEGGDYPPVRYAKLHHQMGLEGHLGSGRATVLTVEGRRRSGSGLMAATAYPSG